MTKMFLKLYTAIELSQDSTIEINNFLESWGVPSKCLYKKLHLTLYEIPIVNTTLFLKHEQEIMNILSHKPNISPKTDETRFMVMSPGGDNPKNNRSVSSSKIGIRFTKRSPLFDYADNIRQELSVLDHQALALTNSSTSRNRNAIGIQNFKPHITLINRNNNLPQSLFEIGAAFRNQIESITFDKFISNVK